MDRLGGALALSLLLTAACSGEADSKKRAGPPAGAVDPSTITNDQLAMGGAPKASPAAATDAAPSGLPGLPSGGPVNPAPATAAKTSREASVPGQTSPSPQGTSAPAAPAPTGAAAGKMVMTADHCKKLGQKFSALAGGGPEGDKIGADFAARCSREQAGSEIDKSEWDCVMAARAVMDIPTCQVSKR